MNYKKQHMVKKLFKVLKVAKNYPKYGRKWPKLEILHNSVNFHFTVQFKSP